MACPVPARSETVVVAGTFDIVHGLELLLFIAGDFGFLTLIRSREGPGRYRFETRPSSIMSEAENRSGPHIFRLWSKKDEDRLLLDLIDDGGKQRS
jgi:hypothetical protein